MTSPEPSEHPPVEPTAPDAAPQSGAPVPAAATPVPELGGRRDGTDPTRFGDWEKSGRCIDF